MPQFIMSKSQMQPTGRSVVTIRHSHKQSGKKCKYRINCTSLVPP